MRASLCSISRMAPLVFVELALIGGAELLTQVTGVRGDKIQNALVVAPAPAPVLSRFALDLVREEPLENQPGVGLLGHRHRLRTPGNARLVSTAIARVAVAGRAAAFTADLQRRKPCQVADLARGELIDQDADLDVRSRRLACRARSGMKR